MALLDYLGMDQAGGSLLSGLSNFAGNNSNALMGLGAGIAGGATNVGGGWGPGVQAGLQGFMGGRQADQKLQIQQASLQALISQGLTPQQAFLAINNPEYMKASALNVFPKFEKFENGQTFGNFNPTNGQTNVTGAAPTFQKLTPGETGGYASPPGAAPIGSPRPGMPAPGSTAPIVPSAVPTTSVAPPPSMAGSYTPIASGGPRQPPEGYQWNDPANPAAGMTPIQGGPAGKMTSDESGRLAMIQSSRQGVEQAKQYFLSPDFKSGAFDTALKAGQQAAGMGDIARHQRAVEMGAEAALRIATGASAPESEVKRYANFYMPSVYDDAATRTQKLAALQRFMDYAERNMASGRAVPLSQIPQPQAFMQGGAASGPPKDQGRVASPAWPPPPSGFTMVP